MFFENYHLFLLFVFAEDPANCGQWTQIVHERVLQNVVVKNVVARGVDTVYNDVSWRFKWKNITFGTCR